MEYTLKYVFIIPYRDRIEHKTFFDYYMNFIMEDYHKDEYKILYCHQDDNRKFNRGAMKNIGFLYIKEKYPETYQNIIFIFNDVDSIPYTKNLLNYNVKDNEIKHYYGYTFALGGIFSIKGKDFEKINGFPNYWAWGFEDNIIYKRALQNKININRNEFYDIFSKKILHFADDFRKLISVKTYEKSLDRHYVENDGLNTLNNINYNYKPKSLTNPNPMLNITNFTSLYKENEDNVYIEHNLFHGKYVGGKKPNKPPGYSMNLFSNNRSLL